jgi:hypothetical protein
MKVDNELTPAQSEAQCSALGNYQWHQQKGWLRIAEAQLPLTPEVVQVSYAAGFSEQKNLKTDTQIGVLVSSVPRDREISFSAKKNKVVVADVGAVLAQSLAYLIPALRALPIKSLFVAPLPEEEDWKLICQNPVPLADLSMPTVATRGTRAFIAGKVTKESSLEVLACEGAKCPADEGLIRNRIDLQPDPGVTFTLMAEVDVSLGTGPMSAPRFDPVGGIEGPDQLYSFVHRTEARDVWSTAMLFAVRFCEGWTVGLGPSLLVGTSGGALTQWNLRAGHRLSGSLYFLAGISVRFVPTATDYLVGAQVSVPKGMAEPAPPKFRTEDRPVFLFSIGLGLDLTVLSDAATSIAKAIGGK